MDILSFSKAGANAVAIAALDSDLDALVIGEFGTAFVTDAMLAADGVKVTKAALTDLASTANAKGASLIGIEDAGTLITATTVEGALAELATAVASRATTASIVNDLTTGGTAVPLSAEQGKTLKSAVDAKVATSAIVNDLTTGGTAVPLSAEQGKTLKGYVNNSLDFTAVSGSGTGSDTYACDVASAREKNFSFTIADTDAKTVTLSNVPTGRCDVFMEITTSAAASVTWTLNSGSTLAWSVGSAPTLASGKIYRILFMTNDNGVTWDGFASAGV